jgi:hypothetical protein
MIGVATDLLYPLFLETAFGKTIFVLTVFLTALGILFAPHAEYLISLALLVLLGWAVDVLGPHPMLAVWVLLVAGLGRIMINTVEGLQDWLEEASVETTAMVMAVVDAVLADDTGPDRREND